KAVADELAPLLKICGFAEIFGVVLQRFPLHEQPVALRHFMRTLQGHELAALGALENRRGLVNSGFELGFHAGLHIDLRNFEDHGAGFRWRVIVKGAALWSAVSAVKRGGAWLTPPPAAARRRR